MTKFNEYVIFLLYPECKEYCNYHVENDIYYNNRYKKVRFMMNKKKIEFFKLFLKDIQYVLDENIYQEDLKLYINVSRFHNLIINFTKRMKHRYSVSHNKESMYLCPFENNSFSIFENNTKYTFNTNEFVKIINNTIYNIIDGNVMENEIKNPYTNIPISYFNLYNIYHIIKSNNLVPKIFQKFYECDFDYNEFYSKYYYYIMTCSIIKNFNTLTKKERDKYLIRMCCTYGCLNYKNISVEILNKIFGHYLEVYYLIIKFNHMKFLEKRHIKKYRNMRRFFNRFMEENPTFGREIISLGIDMKTYRTIDTFYINP